ncbi:MAG: hypothetical protein A2Y60_04965 [Chloroflexi bacterium RBG_13_54_9]|nr:MAG: hypothetical protein A2Y60_04965 [Chloroflexi bacterium RBG_13_54_9]
MWRENSEKVLKGVLRKRAGFEKEEPYVQGMESFISFIRFVWSDGALLGLRIANGESGNPNAAGDYGIPHCNPSGGGGEAHPGRDIAAILY